MRGNIFRRVALESLRHNRTRTLVTVLGVVLSAALFTGIAVFGTSLIQYLMREEIARGGDWHVVFSDADLSLLQELKKDPQAENITAYQNIGYALLEGAEEKSAQKPYLFLAEFGQEALEDLPIHLTIGRMPENSREILIPDHIAIKSGVQIQVGDTLTLTVGNRESEGRNLTQCDPYREDEILTRDGERTYTVTGIYERPGFELHESPGYTVITGQEPGAACEASGSCSVYVKLQDPRKVWNYAGSKSDGSSWAANENLLRFMGISDNRLFHTFLYTVGGVLVLIIMTASVFLIYNSFHISLNERVHQFGILMSVGATARQLKGLVLFEGLCIGCMGIPLGTLAGIGSIRLLLPVVSGRFSSMINSSVSMELAISVPALGAAAVISMVTILISAWIPAKKAASIPVLECIRQTGEIHTEAKEVRAPKFLWKLYGLEGVLAWKNFMRNRRRYRGVVLSLTFSVILIVAGSAFNTTLEQVSRGYTAEGADGDLSLVIENLSETEFLRLFDRLKETEGVKKSTWQINPIYSALTGGLPEDFLKWYRQGMGEDGTGNRQQIPLYTQFIEDDLYYAFIDELGLSREEYQGPDGKVLMCAINSKDHETYDMGNSVDFTLISGNGEQEKTVCAAFVDRYPLDTTFEDVPDRMLVMTVPMERKTQFAEVEPPLEERIQRGILFWTDMPSKTLGEIQNTLLEEGSALEYRIYNLSAAFYLFRNMSFVLHVFTCLFVFMISLIAVANVFNTISTNIRLRRRELAMLRSVGMSDQSFNRMMRFECVCYGTRTLLYGVPLSGLLAWMIHKALISAEEVDIAFSFPWRALGFSVLGVFSVVFITMVYASRRIRREHIIDGLRDEME